jgi:hypothetical protein
MAVAGRELRSADGNIETLARSVCEVVCGYEPARRAIAWWAFLTEANVARNPAFALAMLRAGREFPDLSALRTEALVQLLSSQDAEMRLIAIRASAAGAEF